MLHRLETKVIRAVDECVSFAEQDLFDFMINKMNVQANIMCIDYFEVHKDYRNKGYGSEILKRFCEENKENYVLFLIAGIPIEEAEKPNREEITWKLSKLEKFYTSIGFLNVNENIGQYEQKIPFLYNGGIGINIISKLID